MIRALTSPLLLLRIEGAALFVLGLILYWKIGGNWLAFFLLLLVPDVGMLGYLANPQIGAATYNLVHIMVLPSILGAIGVLTGNAVVLSLALIWFSHINMDRTVGYGLKLPDAFKHTHLDLASNSAWASPLPESVRGR
jgi:hypothetical protein